MRAYIFLGALVHTNNVNINAVNNEQTVLYNATNSLRDLSDVIGFINVSGNVMSKGTGALELVKSEGSVFFYGANYETDPTNPHIKTISEINTSTTGTFQYRMQDGSSSALTLTSVIIDILDDGTAYPGTTLANNQWGVTRVFAFLSNVIKLQPPQFEYSSSEEAISNINSEGWVQEPSFSNGLLIGYIVQREGSDLSTAIFLEAPKFGLGGGGASSGLDISTKLSLDGTSTMTGNLNMGNNDIINVEAITMSNKGTVTQVTSVTDPVTLNKAVGVITSFNGTLVTNTLYSYTFNNSFIAADSVILMTLEGQDSVGPNTHLTVHTDAVAAGSCTIWIANSWGANWTGSYKIHFIVL
jgi:hypothetical protein